MVECGVLPVKKNNFAIIFQAQNLERWSGNIVESF
jgi:hypothetical protein